MSLEALPTEIIQLIFGILTEEHQPSLISVACANHFLYSMALPHLHRTIKITVDAIILLGDQIRAQKRILQRNDSYHHVRHLIIDDGLTKSELFQFELSSSPPISWQDRRWIAMHDAARVTDRTRQDWQSLAVLLRKLPCLSDLVFACCRPFPLCVLHALHRYHPDCRLHIKFLQWGPRASHPSSAEFQLATSPCLFSLVAE